MEDELYSKIKEWSNETGLPLPLETGIEEKLRKLVSPEIVSSLEPLRNLLKPKPSYLGPGIWLRAMGQSGIEGEEHE